MERLEIVRGDARNIEVTLTDEAGDWTPPVGTTLRFTAKTDRRKTDAQATISKSTGAGITVDGNVATVELDAADTDAVSTNGNTTTLYCDVQATGTNWGPWTIASFLLVVTPDVSRTTP